MQIVKTEKERVEICLAHNEERMTKEYDAHRTYGRQEGQRKTANYLPKIISKCIAEEGTYSRKKNY